MEIAIYKPMFVILTMNRGEYFIDESEEQALKRVSINQMFTTKKGVRIRISTITEIMPISEYYKAYPDKRPENLNYTAKSVVELNQIINCLTPDRRVKAIASIINGFKSNFKGKIVPSQSIIMLEKMTERFVKNYGEKHLPV